MKYEINWDKLNELNPDEKQLVLQELNKLERIHDSNPLLFFQPYEKQKTYLASNERFKWILGGNRSGKTLITCIDDIIQACDEKVIPEHLKSYKKWSPPFKWRIVAMDFDQIEMVIFEILKAWIPPSQLLGDDWSKAYSRERRVLRFKNGSLCQFKTYEQPAKNHGGASLHRVHLDEEPPEDIWRENNMRVTDFNGDILCSMTPVEGLTWMYDAFYLPYEKKQLKNVMLMQVDMDDNVYLSEAGKEAALADYSEEERAARKQGKFIHFHGRVYDRFDEDHIIPQAPIPKGVNIYLGIDPGIRHMCAVTYVAHMWDDTLIAFDETCLKNQNVEEVVLEIGKKLAWHGLHYNWAVIDPSARNREAITGRSVQLEFQERGIRCFPGQNDPRAGINRIKVRLEHKKLLVMANCITTIDEFRKYRWSTPPKGRRSENDPKEAPIKKDDHILDALRYVCMARPYTPPLLIPKDPFGKDIPFTQADLSALKDRRIKYKPPQPAWMY